MEHQEQMTTTTTVSSSKPRLFIIIITFITAVSLIVFIAVFLLTTIKYRQASTQIGQIQSFKLFSKSSTVSTTSTLTITTTITTTLSSEEIQRLTLFKEFLHLSSNHPQPNLSRSSIIMNKFMRSVYRQIYDRRGFRRRKRHKNQDSNIYLSDEVDFIVSLPNQYPYSATYVGYYFEYDGSLEHLTFAELILPLHQISLKHLSFSIFNISVKQPFKTDRNWLKINLTQYIRSFPLKFHLGCIHTKKNFSLLALGFLTLRFRRASHPISRRDLSSFYDNQLITYPDDPFYCQVRPLRASFSELNWSSWIIEPSSYEMNICSGTCHTASNMGTYFIVQNMLNQKYPNKIPAPCCRPKRFSSTVLLYYDGPNLVLKVHENMRVVECGCSS